MELPTTNIVLNMDLLIFITNGILIMTRVVKKCVKNAMRDIILMLITNVFNYPKIVNKLMLMEIVKNALTIIMQLKEFVIQMLRQLLHLITVHNINGSMLKRNIMLIMSMDVKKYALNAI